MEKCSQSYVLLVEETCSKNIQVSKYENIPLFGGVWNLTKPYLKWTQNVYRVTNSKNIEMTLITLKGPTLDHSTIFEEKKNFIRLQYSYTSYYSSYSGH